MEVIFMPAILVHDKDFQTFLYL